VIRPIVVAVTVMAGQVIATAAIAVIDAMIGAVMLLTNVSDGIVTSVTGLGDAWSGDRAYSGD
jgi:hypothetical protein